MAQIRERTGTTLGSNLSIQTRYRYNPDVRSPARHGASRHAAAAAHAARHAHRAGSGARKEMGSIINLYVTPVTRVEFCWASNCLTWPWPCSTSCS